MNIWIILILLPQYLAHLLTFLQLIFVRIIGERTAPAIQVIVHEIVVRLDLGPLA